MSDISPGEPSIWAARTSGGMVFVSIPADGAGDIAGADVVTLVDDKGAVIAARLIGPLAGDAPADGLWRIQGRYRVDPDGEPLSSFVSGPVEGDVRSGHQWGALGLPAGLDTRVRALDATSRRDEVELARTSSGHRLGQATWWLSLAPGDRVTTGGVSATVVAVDRRKRTAEIEANGEMQAVALDDLDPHAS